MLSRAFVLTMQPVYAILVPTESSQSAGPYRLVVGFILTLCLLSLYFRTSLRRKVTTSKDLFFKIVVFLSLDDFPGNRHSETEKKATFYINYTHYLVNFLLKRRTFSKTATITILKPSPIDSSLKLYQNQLSPEDNVSFCFPKHEFWLRRVQQYCIHKILLKWE